jgi:branched-chain amino acid transport system permease protein
MSDRQGWDDSLSEPVEGAAEVTASEGPTSPAVGRDEWVARHGERRVGRAGLLGAVEDRWGRIPWWVQWLLFMLVVALVPLFFSSGYVRRVGFDTLLFMLLALGLNVVVGWGGLLDLGYVAFFGCGAYAYAMVCSDQFDIHLPSFVAIPLVVAVTALIGFLVGLPSRRLSGDYLAIVTLFFFQIFLTVVVNGDQLFGKNFTNGANGISNVDPLSFFGHELPVSHEGVFNVAYFYVALAFFAVVLVALRFVNESRTGRAWRALREDSLAAELMSMPVNWLKLLAFAFGAATAGLTGALFASLNAGVFVQDFQFPILITIYTMVILGGSGSQWGVVFGAIIVTVLLEVLRDSEESRWLVYALVVIALAVRLRPLRWLAIVLGGTVVFGFGVRWIAEAVSDSVTAGAVNGSDAIARGIGNWVITPATLGAWGPISYISLVVAVCGLTLLHGRVRLLALIPTLYLAAFVWENVMAAKPEPTRFVVLGAILVVLMIARPEGLLGEKRVEIV